MTTTSDLVTQAVQRGYTRVEEDADGAPVFTPGVINWDFLDNELNLFGPEDQGEWGLTILKCPCCAELNYYVSVFAGENVFFPDGKEDDNGNTVINNRRFTDFDTAIAYARVRSNEFWTQAAA
jgi:hypothetical protein